MESRVPMPFVLIAFSPLFPCETMRAASAFSSVINKNLDSNAGESTLSQKGVGQVLFYYFLSMCRKD
jgi:hypothetical protein